MLSHLHMNVVMSDIAILIGNSNNNLVFSFHKIRISAYRIKAVLIVCNAFYQNLRHILCNRYIVISYIRFKTDSTFA